MNYLTNADFKKQIQVENLNQVISSDPSILDSAVSTAIEEASSYLVQKYDLSTELQSILPYNPTLSTYKAGSRVVLDYPAYVPASSYIVNDCVTNSSKAYICISPTTGVFDISKWDLLGDAGSLFYAAYPQPSFNLYKQYLIGDKVFYKDAVYTCRVATLYMSQEAAIQFRDYDNLPYPNVYPDNINDGVKFWGEGAPYVIPAGAPVTNPTVWISGDTRSQQLVTYMVDMALYHVHSRIAPRNIPELRVKRYDDAIDWLKKCAKGDVTPAVPTKQPRQGGRVRWGGPIKNINSY